MKSLKDMPSTPITNTRFTRYNFPGLKTLTYRGTPYATTLARMLQKIPRTMLDSEVDSGPPLANLNVADRNDWTRGLIEAWAMVLDVLNFYQERIVNEGYLTTAMEERSVMELARATGYEMQPGISASTDLAFTVIKRANEPHQEAILPAGVAVQSVALPGQTPQLFETAVPFTARSEWNAIRPIRFHDNNWRQDICENTTVMRLAGTQTGISAGDVVGIVSQPWFWSVKKQEDNNLFWDDAVGNLKTLALKPPASTLIAGILIFAPAPIPPIDATQEIVELQHVNVDHKNGQTVVSWNDVKGSHISQTVPGTQTGLHKGKFLLLIGNSQEQHNDTQPHLLATVNSVQTEPALQRTTITLEQNPSATIRDCAIPNPTLFVLRQNSNLFTYSASGLFVSDRNNLAWQPKGIGLPNATIHALIEGKNDFIFLGTEKGAYRSEDRGDSWHPLQIGLGDKGVYALALTLENHLLAGTEDGGIYISKDDGVNWSALSGESVIPYKRGLRKLFPTWYDDESLPKTVVRSLVTYKAGSTKYIAAGTDVGVFRSKNGGRSWRPTNRDLPQFDSKTGLSEIAVHNLVVVDNNRLFAGTTAGVFHIKNKIRTKYKITSAILNGVLLALLLLALQRMANMTIEIPEPFASGLLGSISTWFSHILDLYAQQFFLFSTGQIVPLPLLLVGALMVLSLLAAYRFTMRYMDIIEQLDIPTHDLRITQNGDFFAGTDSGVFFAERPSGLMWRTIGRNRSVRFWQSKNYTENMPLFLLPPTVKDDLDQPPLAQSIKDFIKALQPEFDANGAQLEILKAGREWCILNADERPLYEIRLLEFQEVSFLIIYQGLLQPSFILDTAVLPDLDKAKKSDPLQAAFANNKIDLPKQTRVYVVELGNHWQILNKNGLPLYEIQRVENILVVLTPATVMALGNDTNKDELFAGTATGALYSYPITKTDETQSSADSHWERFDPGLTLTGTQGIIFDGVNDKVYAIGSVQEGSIEKQWEPTQLANKIIDLDQVYANILPGSWLALRQEHPWQNKLYRIQNATVIDSADAIKAGKLTRLQVDNNLGLADFDRELATVWGQSETLIFYDDRPLFGDTVKLAEAVPGLQAGQKLIVQGKPMRARIADLPSSLQLLALDSLETEGLEAGESLQILGWEDIPDSTQKRWHLRDANRFEGTVDAEYGRIIFIPAADDDAMINELVRIKALGGDAFSTTITLEKPLGTVYDRTTLNILANIVPATHGTTISDEVLGSSDGQTRNQRFTLRQEPLTFLPGPQNTLQLFVNGVQWGERPFLNDLQPDQHAYMLRQDDRGQTHIIFGDGEHGARPPANNEEITASYRIGSGTNGNLPPARLTQLQSRLGNIQSVTNPLPATGGVNREHPNHTRNLVPIKTRSTQRIVSLSDYEDFTKAFSGISKASAALIWAGEQRVIHITIADQAGNEIAQTSELYTALVEAIDQQRVQPNPPVIIRSFKRVYFDLAAIIIIYADHAKRQDAILAAARKALIHDFDFEVRNFGQPVTWAELITTLQKADSGIWGVKITHLDRQDSHVHQHEDLTLNQNASVEKVVYTKPARWDESDFLPAELLLVNAGGDEGINLAIEVRA